MMVRSCLINCLYIYIFDFINYREMKIENRADGERDSEDSEKEFEQLAKTFALCVAYAANCGGIATLTGTPPNIILKGQADM